MSADLPEVPEADALEQRMPVADEPNENDVERRNRGGDPRDRATDLLDPVDPADAADQAREVPDPYDEEH
jgi:hypothetical protein